MTVLRWFGRNLTTLFLAFVLALVVWIAAVLDSDPNRERTYLRNIIVIGKADNLELISEEPGSARISLRAPESILNRLTNNTNLIRVWVDLSGTPSGQHELPIKVDIDASPVRIIQVEPPSVFLELEDLAERTLPVTLFVEGEPSLGYQKGTPRIEPDSVNVSGPASQVDQVAQILARLDISGANSSIETTVAVLAVDENGDPVSDLLVSPRLVSVTQPINLLGGFRTVVVKVITTGQLANGYRLTNVSVSPPTVTLFSSDRIRVNELPGFVETQPVDLSGVSEDIEVRVGLNLPETISLVGEQSVLVQISAAPIEGSLTISLPVEILGLPPGLTAQVAPPVVDVLVSGPLPMLDTLTSASFRAVVDLTGLSPGAYQLAPVVDLVPEAVIIESILPQTVEVVISEAPTPQAP
ncbi:MAG TPA: CdaR family protein [Anaerolineales bacterium]|nr:CdaR family protein [Anaerolineales bacterium]